MRKLILVLVLLSTLNVILGSCYGISNWFSPKVIIDDLGPFKIVSWIAEN